MHGTTAVENGLNGENEAVAHAGEVVLPPWRRLHDCVTRATAEAAVGVVCTPMPWTVWPARDKSF